jgi:hypothetical protein
VTEPRRGLRRSFGIVRILNHLWHLPGLRWFACVGRAPHPVEAAPDRTQTGFGHCASCHGVDAKGDGPMAKSLKVKPSDLTRISARNGGTFPLMRIERIISGEEPPPSGHGTSEMPVWDRSSPQVERDQDLGRVRIDNLARYLRDIQVHYLGVR